MSIWTYLRHRKYSDDRGSVSAFVVVMTVAMVLLAGLVFDGGRLVSARIEAADHAENAARLGAQVAADLRSTTSSQLDVAAATGEARGYLADQDLAGSVQVQGTTVTVTVTTTRSMTILAMAGVGSKTITVTRSAEAVTQ